MTSLKFPSGKETKPQQGGIAPKPHCMKLGDLSMGTRWTVMDVVVPCHNALL